MTHRPHFLNYIMYLTLKPVIYAGLIFSVNACNLNYKSQAPLRTEEIRTLKIGKTTKGEIEGKYGKPQKDFLTDGAYLACYAGDDGSFGAPWRLMLVAYDEKDRLVKINFDDEAAKRQCKEIMPGQPSSISSSGDFDAISCTLKGKKLYGKIKRVENFEDLKVQIVTAFPELKVKAVDNFPDECGKWQFVDTFEDLKIKIVERNADIKIQFVDAFPGPG